MVRTRRVNLAARQNAGPEIRRAFRRPAKKLQAPGREQQAFGAWIRALIDKANPFRKGESNRQAAKRGDAFVRDDPRVADYRVRIKVGLLSKILAPRGNRPSPAQRARCRDRSNSGAKYEGVRFPDTWP